MPRCIDPSFELFCFDTGSQSVDIRRERMQSVDAAIHVLLNGAEIAFALGGNPLWYRSLSDGGESVCRCAQWSSYGVQHLIDGGEEGLMFATEFRRTGPFL